MRRINRELLRLAIPNIISNISLPLISTVDTALMGHFSGLHLGAIGLAVMIFNFFYWNFGFLRMSTTGFVAQSYGKKEESEIVGHLARALVIATAAAILILIAQTPIVNLSMKLLNATEAQTPLILKYFSIRIWDAPATLGLFVLLGWYFGIQNARIPLLITVVINVANIALSMSFVLVFNMEIAGVAYGTLIAQYLGFALGLGILIFKYRRYLDKYRRETVLKLRAYSRFFRINMDIFFRTILLTLAFGFFYSKSSEAGELVLAVNVILLQFLNWLSYGIDGFAYAAEALVGKYYGAGDKNRTRKAIRFSFYWGGGLAVLYALVYGLGGNELLTIFTNDSEVINAAGEVLVWMFWLPLIGFACYVWDGVFIGLTAGRAMRNTMILAFIVYLLSWYFIGQRYPVHGLWLVFVMFLGARGLFQSLWYFIYGLELK